MPGEPSDELFAALEREKGMVTACLAALKDFLRANQVRSRVRRRREGHMRLEGTLSVGGSLAQRERRAARVALRRVDRQGGNSPKQASKRFTPVSRALAWTGSIF